MSDIKITAEYPSGDNEIDHDADALAKVVAALMRAFGTDPNTISPSDAWQTYIKMHRDGITRTGGHVTPEWEAAMSTEGPLALRFMVEWARHVRLNTLLGVADLSLPLGAKFN